MSELHDQLARVKLHKGLAPLTCIVSRQQFTGVRPLFQTFPARAVFQPTVPANQRRVLQEAHVNGPKLVDKHSKTTRNPHTFSAVLSWLTLAQPASSPGHENNTRHQPPGAFEKRLDCVQPDAPRVVRRRAI